MTKTAMKAYMDKNDRLIIIIDQPGAGLTELVKSFLGGSIPEVQHLDAPTPMSTPEIDTTGMKEITSPQQTTKPAKFIRNKENSTPVSSGKPSADAALKISADMISEKTKPEEAKPEKTKSEEAKVEENSTPVSVSNNTESTESSVQLVECMTVFELQDYLRARRNDEKLVAILAENTHAPLDFILHVKSEREIRDIAKKLAN